MQKSKNTVVAGFITMAILTIMTGSIDALHAKQENTKVKGPVVQTPAVINKKKPQAVHAVPVAVTPAPTTAPTPVVAPTPPSAPAPVITPTPVTTPTPAPTPAPAPTYVYKDGTYPTTVSYSVPGTVATLNVSLTVVQDKITASSVSDPPSTDPTSRNWDNRFIADYQQYVIGHDLSTLNLSNTSGASLTTAGFNNAVSQIRNAAHS